DSRIFAGEQPASMECLADMLDAGFAARIDAAPGVLAKAADAAVNAADLDAEGIVACGAVDGTGRDADIVVEVLDQPRNLVDAVDIVAQLFVGVPGTQMHEAAAAL